MLCLPVDSENAEMWHTGFRNNFKPSVVLFKMKSQTSAEPFMMYVERLLRETEYVYHEHIICVLTIKLSK